MPFLRPDVIKLDLRLVQGPPAKVAEIVHAVSAESERTGALVVAEGIETEEHEARAITLGAALGQGYRFGRPAPLPAVLPRVGSRDREPAPAARVARHAVRARAALAARPAWSQAAPAADRPAARGARARARAGQRVLVAFQEAASLGGATSERYERLGRVAAFVGALGAGMDGAPAPGVLGVDLAPDDPLRYEWALVVVGAHFAAAFVARDLGDAGEDAERRFDFAVTYNGTSPWPPRTSSWPGSRGRERAADTGFFVEPPIRLSLAAAYPSE